MKKIIISLAVLSLAITSCNRDDSSISDSNSIESSKSLDKTYIKSANLSDQLVYKKHFLQEAGKVIGKLGITTDDLINLSIGASAKGQQENTFLLRDIVELARSRNKLNSDIEKSILQLENAFVGLDESKYDISIYIPFAEKLHSSRQNQNNRGMGDEESDIFIFEDQDNSEQKYFEGYVLNEDGNYVSYDELINEDMADVLSGMGRNVAVIGLQQQNPGGGTGGSGSTAINKHLKIGNMIVRDHKESWIAGASEITIQMYKYENGTVQKINFINSSTAGGNSENIFTDFKRKDVKNQTQRYLGATVAGMIDTNPSVYNNSKFMYAIYEADNWPVTTRSIPFTAPNGQSFNITFGSSDGEYYNSKQNSMQIANVAENGSIKFSPFLQ